VSTVRRSGDWLPCPVNRRLDQFIGPGLVNGADGFEHPSAVPEGHGSDAYAGDTRILDLQPKEERLLSYAIDQSTEVQTTTKTYPGPEMNFKIGGDTLTAGFTLRQTTTYTLKNRGTHRAHRPPGARHRQRLEAGRTAKAGRQEPRRLPLQRHRARRRDGQAGGDRGAAAARPGGAGGHQGRAALLWRRRGDRGPPAGEGQPRAAPVAQDRQGRGPGENGDGSRQRAPRKRARRTA